MKANEAAELAVVLLRNAKPKAMKTPYAIGQDVLTLSKIAKRALTRGVRMCNDGHYSEKAQERDAERLRDNAKDALQSYRVKSFHVGGDPRGGSCFSIVFRDGSKNGFGDGWNV